MRRLSEICRDRPLQLASFLAGQKSWLLAEFNRQVHKIPVADALAPVIPV